MEIFEKKEDLARYLEVFRNKGLSAGFVPTMGALHKGHLALVEKAKKENGLVVSSIFVNPTQFNNREDLVNYPRTLEEDIKKLKTVKCDVLFAPDEKTMYPEGDPYNDLSIDFGSLDKVMEGKFRPGHFKGVVVIVNKLFRMVLPDKAYFGEKDYQQLQVIKKMVEVLKHRVVIVPCPTIREEDGLAMSSRNVRLSADERKEAPFIYKMLMKGREMKEKYPVESVRAFVINEFSENRNFRLEYFEISDGDTLEPVDSWNDSKTAVACVAAFLGNVRLIDNIQL